MKWLPIGAGTVALGVFLLLVFGGAPGDRPDGRPNSRADRPAPVEESAPTSASPPVAAERAAIPVDDHAGPFAADRPRVTRRGVLAGRVVDEAGAPLADVVISAHPGDNEAAARWPRFLDPFSGRLTNEEPIAGVTKTAASTQSGDDGRFRLGDVPADEHYTLLLHRGDRAPLRRGTFPAWADRTTDCGSFTLGVGAAVEGIVVDDLGRPIAEATVGRISAGATPPVATDRDGRFRLDGLEAGVIRLGASADGHVGLGLFARFNVDAAAGETTHDVRIELARAASISGRVIDEVGAPHADVTVTARPTGARMRAGGARTDARGRFVIEGLAIGRPHEISAGDESIEATPPAVSVEFVRPRPQTVRLTAVDAVSGGPVELYEYRWANDRSTTRPSFFGLLGNDGEPGRYRVPFPTEGTHRLIVTADGYEPAESEPIATEGVTELAPIAIVLRRLSTPRGLHGVVRRAADGTPVPNAEITLGPWKSEYARTLHGVPVVESHVSVRERPIRTADDGTFTVPQTPEPDDCLRVASPDHAARILPASDLAAGTADDPVEILLEPGGRLEGAVLGMDGHPKHDLPVVLHREDDSTRITRTGPDGRYHFSTLTPGIWWCAPGDAYAAASSIPRGEDAAALHDELRANHASVRIDAGETARLDLDLRAFGGAVRGHLLVDGVPQKSHRVWLRPAALADALPHSGALLAWTGHDGDFEFTKIPPGAYLLAATTDRGAHPLIEATVGIMRGRLERVELAAVTGRLAGVVRVAGRADVPRGSVHVRTERPVGPFPAGLSVASASIAEDGTFEVTGVPPGRYLAVASIPKIGEQSRPVVITADRTARTSFLLDVPGQLRVTLEGVSLDENIVDVALEQNGTPTLGRAMRREKNGDLFLEGLAPGNYRLVVSRLRFVPPEMQRTELGSADVVVRRGETTPVTLAATNDD